jgi:hypothetical protein
MIRHVVFFKFKAETPAEDRRSALDGLRALPPKIPAIREYEVGENVLPSPRAWDASLIATYESLEKLKEYSDHPEHQAVAVRLRGACESIGSVDYEF